MSAAFDVVIVGSGNAGVSLSARLRRDGIRSVALVDPTPVHRYRPMLNYAAGAGAPMGRYERPVHTVVPGGVELLPHAATAVDTASRTVTLDSGATVGYRDLVLCPGLTPQWESIPGLREAFVAGWAVSAHVPEYAGQGCAALVRHREGTVVFSVPPEPASCGGTVLKAMFLACDRWRREGVLERIGVHLVTPFTGVLGLEPTDARLRRALDRYGVTVHDRTRVSSVDHVARTVTLGGPAPFTLEDVGTAYVTPHSRAPGFIAEAGLAVGGAAGADPGYADGPGAPDHADASSLVLGAPSPHLRLRPVRAAGRLLPQAPAGPRLIRRRPPRTDGPRRARSAAPAAASVRRELDALPPCPRQLGATLQVHAHMVQGRAADRERPLVGGAHRTAAAATDVQRLVHAEHRRGRHGDPPLPHLLAVHNQGQVGSGRDPAVVPELQLHGARTPRQRLGPGRAAVVPTEEVVLEDGDAVAEIQGHAAEPSAHAQQDALALPRLVHVEGRGEQERPVEQPGRGLLVESVHVRVQRDRGAAGHRVGRTVVRAGLAAHRAVVQWQHVVAGGLGDELGLEPLEDLRVFGGQIACL